MRNVGLLLLLTACAADATPIEADVVVGEVGLASPVRPGTTCTLRMQPAWRSGVNCQVLLRCGSGETEHDLFGGRRIGGYSVCETEGHAFASAFDGEHVRDGDPALSVDLTRRTLTWRGPNAGETATLTLTGEPRAIAAWDESYR